MEFREECKIVGHVTIEELDKKGNALRSKTYKNTLVDTGSQFLLDLLSNNLTEYQGNTSLSWGACGSINRATTTSDWKLEGEGTLNEGGAVCRVRMDTSKTSRTDNVATFHTVFTVGDFPILPYSIGEAGMFLGNRPPTSDPQSDSTQRPYAMFNRVTFDPPWTKENDLTDIRIKFSVTMTGS